MCSKKAPKGGGDFSVAELHARVPSVGLDLIRKVLKGEKAAGHIVSLGERAHGAAAEG